MPDSKVLAQWLAEQEELTKRLTSQRERIEGEIAKAQQQIALLRNLLTLQSSPYVVQQPALPKGRFSDEKVTVRDAALTVLRERQRANLDQIIEGLHAGGLDFGGRSPKRVVFLTLTNLIRGKNGGAPIRRQGEDYIYVEGNS